MMKRLFDNLRSIDPEKERREAEAKESMKGWEQKLKGIASADEDDVSLTPDGAILQVIFKGGPYIRVVYGEEGHPPGEPFSFYHFTGPKKDEFFPSHNESKRLHRTAEEIENYLSQPAEVIKRGEWPPLEAIKDGEQPSREWPHGPGAAEEGD